MINLVTYEELWKCREHKVKLIDVYDQVRITEVDLVESPSDSGCGQAAIGVTDSIYPDYLLQEDIKSIEIID